MSHVDLSALRLDQAPAAVPRRPFGPRLLVAAAVLLVLGTALTFAWPLLRPARLVPTAAIRAATAPGAAATATVAEAVGWVEADPFPVVVRPLVAGRIESIHVLEGAAVQAGKTVIATLANANLQAAHERAVVIAAERDAEYAIAVEAHGQAQARFAQKAEARRAVAEARMAAALAEEKLAQVRGAHDRAVAEARGATAAVLAQEQLLAAGTSNTVALERARAAVAAADASVTATRTEIVADEAGRAAAAAAVALAEELFANTVELEWAVRTAGAEVEKARAAQAAARAELAIAAREWQWAKEVVAPVDGVVLRLLAMPGATTGPEHEGILAIYDPAHLRARIDVPLGSLDGVVEGQQVELRSEVTGRTIVRGVVQRLQHESDLLKNTLQVKIGLIDPPPLWRPETLCRARFLGTERPGAAAPEAAFLVPKTAVQGEAVFVIDPARRAARAIAVTIVGEQGDDVIVRGELSVTQRVILAAVQDGETVREEIR